MGMSAGGIAPAQPRRLVRRIATAAAALGFAAIAGHGAIWWWVTGEIEKQVAANLAAPVPGWQVTAGALHRTGWPFAATVTVPGLIAVSPGSAAQSVRWQAERVAVSLEFARPRTLVLMVEGAQSLQLGSAAPIPVRAELMRAEVPLEPGVPVRAATLAVAGLVAELPAGRLAIARLDTALDSRPAAQQGETAGSLVTTARGIDLPPRLPWPLGPRIATLAWDLAISGPVPPIADSATRAEAWRDGGGAVTLRRLELAWGDVTLTGGATLALDPQLQPMGTATARLAGYDAALRALTVAGVLPPRTAVAAAAVLALMARPSPDGGPPAVEAPLSLQNRTLALGRIPLLRLPELVWRPPS
jgi:hypothetical protein